jgi:D-glycero-alpha-D-manno-heptose-7-phosphate kinase
MIISKTPLRVSFAGGGTDIADYYGTGYGVVVSSAIRKYVYVTVNTSYDDIRISCAKTGIVPASEGAT